MERHEKINEFMLGLFKENEIPDTTENRLHFLTELQKVWKPETELDREFWVEKLMYQAALSSEIFGLQMKLRFPTLFE